MKKLNLFAFLFLFLLSVTNVDAQNTNQEHWTKHQAKKWLKHNQNWSNGLSIKPHKSIDAIQFATQYHLNQPYWDKAFAFLKEQNLQTIKVGRYNIEGDNGDKVYAMVSEDPSKNFDKTNWESHRKFIDLQYVIRGEEKMGKAAVASATVTRPYDETKDVANYSAEGKIYTVPEGTFILFFPSDAHRPNITPGGNKVVKKIVVKVRVAE
jgi:YhcH/YjgK/YiaL family protein